MVANTLLVVDLIGKNVLARLVNSLGMVHTANRDWGGAFMPDQTYKIGSTVRIRLPTYFTSVEGAALSIQGVIENETDLTISYQRHVDVAFTSVQEQRFLQDPETNVYEGAAQELANWMDRRLVEAGMQNIYRTIGTAGAGVTSFAVPNLAITTQRQFGVVGSKYMVFNCQDAGTLRNALQNSFNVPFNTEISQQATLGNLGGHDLFEDQNMAIHTTGTFPGTVVIAGAGQDGSELDLSGFTASQTGVLLANDVITIAGVYAVNPTNREQVGLGTGNLAKFIVQAPVNSDGAGLATVTIAPAIVTSGPYQNVTAGPANTAAVSCYGVTVAGTAVQHSNNFCYSEDAFTLACVPGPISKGAAYSKLFTDPDTNISMRLNIVYDPQTDQDIMRFDTFYGRQCFGQFATRFIG